MLTHFLRSTIFTVCLVVCGQASFAADAVSWNYTGTMNSARSNHTATLLRDGQVLVVGGKADSSPDRAEAYDPTSHQWSYTESLGYTVAGHTATLLRDGRVLVAGGGMASGASLPYTTAKIYDPADGTWTETGSLNTGRRSHTATLLPNGEVLVAGGFKFDNGQTTVFDSAEIYNPTTGLWRQVVPRFLGV